MHFLDKQYKKTRWLALAFYFMQKTNKTRSACQWNKLHINAEKRGPSQKINQNCPINNNSRDQKYCFEPKIRYPSIVKLLIIYNQKGYPDYSPLESMPRCQYG